MTRKEALEYINNMWMSGETHDALETLIPEFGKTCSDKAIDYEEKYNEALENMRAIYPNLKGDAKLAVEHAFPELAESEDEKIRKDIINLIYWLKGNPSLCSQYYKDRYEGMLAWLEKQKENIEKEYVFRPLAGTDITVAADQAIRKANEGERLVLAFNGAYIPVRKGVNANKIVDIYDAFIEKQKEEGYEAIPVESTLEYKLGFKAGKDSEKQKEQKVGIGSEIVAPVGQAICIDPELINPEPKPIQKEQKQEWSEEDQKSLIRAINICISDFGEECETSRFLKSLPERFNLQPKNEWSEEDEEMLEYIIGDVNDAKQLYKTQEAKDMADKEIAWLKSLRPQKLDASKLENYDPVEVLNKIKTKWPMAWEKVVGKQEWTEEEKQKLNRIYSIIGWAMDEHAFSSCKKLIGDKEGVELQDFLRSIAKPEQQPSWKPSKEQMKALKEVAYNIVGTGTETDVYLVQLYEQLKKLM